MHPPDDRSPVSPASSPLARRARRLAQLDAHERDDAAFAVACARAATRQRTPRMPDPWVLALRGGR